MKTHFPDATLLFAVVIALIGGLVGTGAGYGLAYLLTNLYAGALNIPLVTHEFQAMPLVISMAASLAVALVAAATPAWAASRILPAPAMRPSPETALAESKHDRRSPGCGSSSPESRDRIYPGREPASTGSVPGPVRRDRPG